MPPLLVFSAAGHSSHPLSSPWSPHIRVPQISDTGLYSGHTSLQPGGAWNIHAIKISTFMSLALCPSSSVFPGTQLWSQPSICFIASEVSLMSTNITKITLNWRKFCLPVQARKRENDYFIRKKKEKEKKLKTLCDNRVKNYPLKLWGEKKEPPTQTDP